MLSADTSQLITAKPVPTRAQDYCQQYRLQLNGLRTLKTGANTHTRGSRCSAALIAGRGVSFTTKVQLGHPWGSDYKEYRAPTTVKITPLGWITRCRRGVTHSPMSADCRTARSGPRSSRALPLHPLAPPPLPTTKEPPPTVRASTTSPHSTFGRRLRLRLRPPSSLPTQSAQPPHSPARLDSDVGHVLKSAVGWNYPSPARHDLIIQEGKGRLRQLTQPKATTSVFIEQIGEVCGCCKGTGNDGRPACAEPDTLDICVSVHSPCGFAIWLC